MSQYIVCFFIFVTKPWSSVVTVSTFEMHSGRFQSEERKLKCLDWPSRDQGQFLLRSGKKTVRYLGQLLNLVGVEVELLQSSLEAEDLLGDLLQAAVRVVQHRDHLLLAAEASARHQPPDQLPLGGHFQTLHCRERKSRGEEGGHQSETCRVKRAPLPLPPVSSAFRVFASRKSGKISSHVQSM